jgi:hypothetical protein
VPPGTLLAYLIGVYVIGLVIAFFSEVIPRCRPNGARL